jgi:hypothetical protein
MKTRNKIQHLRSAAGIAALTVAATATMHSAEAAPRVQLNGQPLATSIAPIVMNGRTLVPMRDIFEALNATVNWNAATRSISATRGTTDVWLQIGNRAAKVNAQSVTLDQAPLIRSQSTLVPLRFVSEALGASVNWNGGAQLVSISTGNGPGAPAGSNVAGVQTISVPAGAVVPVTLDQQLSSATAKQGDTFLTTVKSERTGDSEFPTGTKIEGIVLSTVQMDKDRPGAIDVEFRNVILPDGTRRAINGSLISLDEDDVTRPSQGRIVAKPSSGKDDNTKSILIGAGAGVLIGKVLLKKNTILSAAIGALGGYLYGKRNDNDQKPAEAVVASGTTLGVRLNSSVTYADTSGYSEQRNPYLTLR